MKFINPKIDLAFKRIFGSPQSKEVLISFIDALIYGGQPTVEDLEIIDPFQLPKALGLKDTYLDVKARLKNNTLVIIEMQVLNLAAFEKRVLYNAAKGYVIQLEARQSYRVLYPVIALTITDFVLFPEIANPVTSFILKERTFNLPYTHNDIELVFAELPKFQRRVEEAQTLTEQWLAFLRYAQELDEIPPQMAGVGALQRAFELANQAGLKAEELDVLEKSETFVADTRKTLELQLAAGREEGRQEGLQEGLRNAIELGLELKFGEEGLELRPEIAQITQVEVLKALQQALKKAHTLAEIREIYQAR